MGVRQYREEDIDMIRGFAPELADEIMYHGDCDHDSILVYDEKNIVQGVAFWLKDMSWEYIDSELVDTHYLLVECKVKSGVDGELEIYSELLTALDNISEDIRNVPKQNIVCFRMWCKDNQYSMMEFLMSHGYEAARIMHVMEHGLTDIQQRQCREGFTYREVDMDTEWKQYFEANEDGFGIKDSEAEMHYRLRQPDTKVFGIYEGDKLAGSVTIWKIDDDTYAAENIFVRQEYLHEGVAGPLINGVLMNLKELGIKKARLTVFADNPEAIQVYLAYGYTLSYNLVEYIN